MFPEGGYPGELVQDAEGNLYGTAAAGGNVNCFAPNGCGTVFKLDTAGTLTVLHTFNGADGEGPDGLIQGDQGNLYGTTAVGGAYGYGTVFKLDSSGVLTVMYSFNGSDGSQPGTGLTGDGMNNFFGTTSLGGEYGGTNGYGTVFEMDSSGTLKVLHNFKY